MTTSCADLPVVVDRAAATPLATQISAQVRSAVTVGVLSTGDRLPSTRDLATVLGVSRTVVTTAYAQLFAEGWLEGRHGSGTYIAEVAPTAAPAAISPTTPTASPAAHLPVATSSTPPDPSTPQGLINLSPGIPWAAGIEPAVWRRAWRHAGTRPPSLWPDPHGLPELRTELAAYLRRSRGLSVTPAHILVTRGVSAGLTLLAAEVLRPGDKVGLEDPGYPAAREVLRRAGAQVVPCRVDAHGIIPDELPGDLRLLYTTPAHQYPLGGRLPVGRRQALAAWARRAGAIVVEDDYDSEFRYDVGPLPALRSMDPELIVYLGTASKVLAPGFGAGWLIADPGLVERLAELRPALGERVPEPVQHAFLALLTSGDLERHIRKMRLEYARRRAALVDALTSPGAARHAVPGAHNGHAVPGARAAGHPGAADAPPEPGTFRLLGDTAGMHLVLELPAGFPAGRLAAAAAERGIGLHTVDRYFAGQPTLSGLILGYGAAPLTQIRRAASELGPLLSTLLLGGDRQCVGPGQRGWQFPRVDLQHVRSRQPVGVYPAGPDVDAAGYLRGAEVAAARPEHPAALGVRDQIAGRLAGRPAARHSPRVQPAHDGIGPD
jgi:GntR family transcriptional regulator / MocR family aminotransferase